MKTLYNILLLAGAVLQSCQPHTDVAPQDMPGNVAFSLSPGSSGSGRINDSGLPPSARLILSIETASSTPVLYRDTLSLLVLNGQIVSTPITLEAGDYKLTELLVIGENTDSADEVFYAAPPAGPQESLVDHPLPLFFSVETGQLTSLTVEVIAASFFTPEELGFFSVDLRLTHHLLVSVSIPQEGGLKYTDATAALLHEGDTLQKFGLCEGLNPVKFAGDTDEKFTLVITKSGYARYSKDFTVAEIGSTLEHSLLSVVLEPALTFIASPHAVQEDYPFIFSVNHPVMIDWGDGFTEAYEGGYAEIYHEYETAGHYFVSVTGELDKITRFSSYYGQGPLKNIDLRHLTQLEDFRNGWNDHLAAPAIIDFTHNSRLKYLDVSVSESLERLILPAEHELQDVLIFGPNKLTEEAVDYIVGSVYESAIADNREAGGFFLQYMSDESSRVPISATSLAKLKELKTNYNWQIVPDPDTL